MSSHFGIRKPGEQTPFIWMDDEPAAYRFAEKCRCEVVGPLPDEEAHALGMSLSGKFTEVEVNAR